MFAEQLVRVTSRRRAPPQFRPFIDGAVRYWSRGRRLARAWAPHLSHARGLIDTTIDDITSRRTVVVLGSGPLFDIPLESLARTFSRVVLVDRAHLSAIDSRLARYRNIQLDWRDLSSGCAFLADIPDLDWVISAGLVSELAAQAGPAAPAAVDAHLDGLARLQCTATLIADLDFRLLNRHGVLIDGGDLLHGRPAPRTGLRWKWEVAPFGEIHRHTRRVHQMGAWADWRGA